jgi:CheY-like chemotaxis protein/HPt (histidine-containing phosphotransfer) domain-containing protein/two-component sensor histidine kinase
MVATAENSAQSLLQIVGDVLDFSKIEASKLELAPTTLDLRVVIHGVVETFRHTASAKGLLLTSSIDERLAPAHVADALRVRQILTNFLSNAVKFTEVGGIELAARATEDSAAAQTVELAVTDTGVGVSAEQQRALFTDYAQADASTAQRFGGTGLGLVICRRLAALMGGEVAMESQEGRGTTMRATLPLPVGDPAAIDPLTLTPSGRSAAARPKPTREEAEREGSLILVAEDHAVNRTVLLHQLDIVGFVADFADDGQQAFERYKSGRYGLLLTDLNMPRMDGYELARAIRRYEQETSRPPIPIIALTANVMQGEPERCRDAGMDDFAAKPTTVPFLAAKLHHWLPGLDWAQEVPRETAGNGLPATADGILDLAVLSDVTGGDAKLSRALVADFVSTAHTDLQALDDALATSEVEDVRRCAHRIKGAARTVGATAVGAASQQLESAAANSADASQLVALAERLREAFAACETAIGDLAP